MDAYLRDTGIEMETYSRNGVASAGYREHASVRRNAAGDGVRWGDYRDYEAIVRAVLVAYVKSRSMGSA